MATDRAKESTGVAKEKRVLSSDSQSRKSSSRTAEKGSHPLGSEKQVPNYLKPTVSSRPETRQRSFQLRSNSTSDPNLDRRRSFDRPPSVSKFSKQASPSTSRLHKALVSPGPRERTVRQRDASSVSAKTSTASSVSAKTSAASSKPISTKTVRDGKSRQPVSTLKSTVKKGSTSNKQAFAAKSSTKAQKTNAETTKTAVTQNVEDPDLQQETKEASHDGVAEEVEKVENVENVSQETETSELVNGEHDDNEVKESDHDPQIKSDDDKVIPRVSEEVNTDPGVEVEKEESETEKTAEEEKAENHEHEVEENIKQDHKEEENKTERGENIKQDRDDESNDEISHPQPKDQIHATEEDLVEVDKEEKQEEEQHHDVENGQNVKEELENKEVIEVDDGRVSEEVDLKEKVEEEAHDHQVEDGTEEEEEEGSRNEEATKKNESTAELEQEAAASEGRGKKENTIAHNDVIEETKNRLTGTRKNKVSALVGAFQSVIDSKSSSK